jgi:hypothetical protein
MKSLAIVLFFLVGALGANFSTATACGGDYFPHYVWGQGHVPIYVIDISIKNPPPGGLMVKVAGKKEYISETREDQGVSSLQLMLPEGDYEITYSYVYEGYTYEKVVKKQVAVSPVSATCWQVDAAKIPFPGNLIGEPGEKYLLPFKQAVKVEIFVTEWATSGSHWILGAAGNSVFAYSQSEGEWKPWGDKKGTPPVKYTDLAPTFEVGTFSMFDLKLPPGSTVHFGSGYAPKGATYPEKVTYFTIYVLP